MGVLNFIIMKVDYFTLIFDILVSMALFIAYTICGVFTTHSPITHFQSVYRSI